MSQTGARNSILFIMFRRVDLAERAFAAIRAARPPRLYLAADGPRHHIPGEAEQCARTRAAVDALIDWPCDVHRHYSAENLGCGQHVSRAITRAFEHEEHLIIIEDDCVAHPTFFPFCDELLERYASEERVAMISGCQFVPGGWRDATASYSFVQQSQIWGWATWKRAWQHYDFEMRAWEDERARGLLRRVFRRGTHRRYWTRNFEHALHIDSWDYQWCFARWRNGQVGIVPKRNLVSNIGFGADALHTKAAHHPVANLPVEPMEFPLNHPAAIAPDEKLDDHISRLLFCDGFAAWWNYQRDQRLARWLPALFPPR